MSKPDYDQIKLSNQLCFALYSANNAVVRAYRPFLDELDLTYSQFIVMMALWEEDGISLKKLSELTRLDSGTLTPILKRLEKKGFVKRTRSKEDERLRVLTVTKAGWAARDQAAKIPEVVKCKIGLPRPLLKEVMANCDEIAKRLIEQDE